MPAVETSVFLEFCEAGLWSGVGPALAQSFADAGIDSPDTVTEQSLAALPTVTDKRARTLYLAWVGAQQSYELVALLLPHGLPVRWARRLTERLGANAAAVLTADPWQLLILPDARVEQADRFARLLQPDVLALDPRRARALVARVLALEAREGHTIAPVSLVAGGLAPYGISGADQVTAAIFAAVQRGLVRFQGERESDSAASIGLETLARAEETIARELARIADGARPLAKPAVARAATGGLDATQAGAVTHAAAHGISLLTGGPGTGKSRTVTALVRLCSRVGAEIALAAPTGRAAKRLTELLMQAAIPDGTNPDGTNPNDAADDGAADPAPGRSASAAAKASTLSTAAASGCTVDSGTTEAQRANVEAVTIHRLLGARLIADGEDGTSRSIFEHDADDPIEADVVVIDETSMLDVELAAALLCAIPTGAHLLFVGDPAQLPSIGPGRVLADILAAERYPVTELTTLYRQTEGGAIARLATAVRGGELARPDATDREVVIVPASDSAQAARRVVQLVSDSIPRVFGTDPQQIQVITPVHRGPAGTQALNEELKKVLNPGAGRVRKGVRGFDIGDRVVATANHFDAEPTGYANGEIGTVADADSRSLVVDFPGGPAEISGKALGDLLHGWAITVHRAQGSEWDAVVAVFPPEAGRMLSRPLVYTALTRARSHLSVVHAAGPGLAHAVRRIGAQPRRTSLTALVAANSVIPGSR